MSFILDALKKSENERQRQHGPALADVPLRKHGTTKPWWVVTVAVLLAVNLGVLLFVLAGHRDPPSSPAGTEQPAPPPAVPANQKVAPTPKIEPRPAAPAPNGAKPTSPADVRPLAEEANPPAEIEYETVPASVAANALPNGPPLVRSLNGAKPPEPVYSTAESTDRVPTINDVGGPNAAGVPDLHLDIHVYSKQPSERFVFVNNRKYVEGQTLSDGPVVERITPDGVILNSRGKRFLLPRQ